MSKLFLTGCNHLGHKNVLKFCPNRDFKTIKEHDETYIRNHNKIVSDRDDVWFLGDFAFRNDKSIKEYLDALNGRKHIIFGNHDHHKNGVINSRNLFESSYGDKKYLAIFELKHQKEKYVLSHYPQLSWSARSHGRIHFFCHIHSNKDRPFGCQPNSCDIGVDAWDMRPVLIEDAVERAKSKIGKLKIFNRYDDMIGDID